MNGSEEWYDVTCITDSYQIERTFSGRFRHRPLKINPEMLLEEERGEGPWCPGLPKGHRWEK